MGLKLASLFALGLALSCASEIKKGRSQNHGHYVCSTWGNNHFKTFDGDFYQFPGLCDYNFASDCREAYKEFSVHIQRDTNQNGHPEIQYVLITIKDIVIYLTQHTAVVDEQVVKTPYYSSGLLIESTEVYTKVYARAGLILMWNRKDALMLELDSKFNNNTCGLCGDYNGLQVYNEFISNGMRFNPITFGNMQKINKPGGVCEDPDETTNIATCNQHRDECLSLLTSSEFSDCVSRLNLEMYVEFCMQDKCACHGTEDSFCLCSTISEFSRQCSHAGGQPGNWRTDKFCPMTCPGNMIYQESSSPCINTCSHLEVSSLCEEHHMDGCFCPEGTVYDDVNEKGCVSVSECYCKQHGVMYSPGQTITNECEKCTCDSGRWLCNDLPCPGSCLLEGGAHITTFDKKKYTFHGDCFYVLAKGGVNDSHALLAELSPCGATDTQTCLKSVMLLIDHKKNSLTVRSDGTVLLNDMVVHLPHVTASFSVFQPSSYHIIVQTHFGLKLQIQLVPIMQLFVIVDQNVQGQLQGLCGNFNGMAGDDFKTPGGLVEATGSAFANTWKAQPTCRDQVDRLEDPCALSVENENYAEFWCSQLKNSESLFARCHSVIDPTEYYKRCKYDTCSCSNSEECLCAALSSYVRACAFKGIMLGGWRQNVCNKEVSSCPSSQVFLYNLTTCQHTCRSLADGQNQCVKGFIPVDGCGCPGNTYMDEKGKCVNISQCSCYHRGTYLEPGDVIFKQEERCVCRNAVLHCTQVKITGEKCLSPKTHLDCSNVNSRSSPVLPQLSCHSLGAGYLPTECISGCICPSGLFDDGRGGCVSENDCPCIHNGDFYPPGHTTTAGCNNCTCYKGKWKCTMNECYGTCIIYGSGHYVTFDGKHYDFDGHCEYVAAQDYCGEDPSGTFSIITVNVPCGTTGVTCSKAIKVFLKGIELKLEDKRYVEIHRDAGEHVHYWTRTVGLYLVIETSSGVMLIWDKKTTIFVKLTPNYKGKICGLCGNFDENSNNDFTTRDGLQVSSPLEFGNSWRSSLSCPDVMNEILPCNLKPHRKSWAEKECSIILSQVFEGCRSKVDPRPFYENCVHDACSCDTGGDCECFCSAVAAYAQECVKHEACVHWRTPDICPIFCDFYNHYNECTWHYEPCGRHIATCRLLSNANTNFPLPYLEGCYPRCPEEKPIYDEDLRICVDICPCYSENGTRYEPGEKVPSDGPCEDCTCISGRNVTCIHIPGCPSTTTPSSTTTPPTTTTTTTTTTTSVSTSTTPTVSTTTSSPATKPCVCWWSGWIDVSYPDFFLNPGDYETYENIRKWNDSAICDQPIDIECRAERYPNLPIEDLGQIVKCDVSTGLVCSNKDQTPGPFMPVEKCLNYEIRVNCCSITCGTTAHTTTTSITTTATTTPKTTTPNTTSTTTETTTPSTTTPTTTTTTETPTPSTTTPTTSTTTSTETPTPSTTTPTTTTTETPTPSTTTPTTTTTTEPTPSTTTPTTTTETLTTTPTTTTTETPTPSTTTPTSTTTTETPTPSTTTPTTTTTETPTPSTTTPTTTTTETPTPSTTAPTTTSTTTETSTPLTTTATTTSTTTEPSTPSTTIPTITTTTTETTSPSTTTPATTTTVTTTPTPCTPNDVTVCSWSDWIDVSYPDFTTNPGDYETYENIRKPNDSAICDQPIDIECRAEKYPELPLEDLGQIVKCDVSTGLVCNNKDQMPGPVVSFPMCLNYEIRVNCCSITCGTTAHTTTTSVTTTATTTPKTTPPTTTSTTTETTTPSTTTPTTTTTTETPTPSTTTPTTSTTTSTETPTPSTTTPTTTTTETPTTSTTTPTTTTTTEPTPSTTTPTTTTETPTPSTTPTTTTTETPTPSTTTSTTTTTETPTPSTTTPTTTPTETPTPSTTTPTTTTTETPTPSTTTPTTTTTETPTPSTTTPTSTTTTETPTPSTTTPTTTTTETPTPSTTTPTTTTTETPTPSTTAPTTTSTTAETSTPLTTTATTTSTTTEPSTPSTTIPTITTTTTETTSPSTTTPATTTTVTTTPTPCTPNDVTVCSWSDWIDVSYPDFTTNPGDYETYENIRKPNDSAICDQPIDIECRAEKYPELPLEDLGQIVKCDVSTGLVCNNKDQMPGPVVSFPMCLNYEIRVNCCSITCGTTAHTTTTSVTTTATTTPKTTPPTTTSTTTETTTPSTTTPTTTTTTETPTPSTTTPTTSTTTSTETPTPSTTTPTTTTTETPTPSTTTPTTTTTIEPTPSTTTPTTTTETPTPSTTPTTTTTETPTPSTTTSTTTTTETPTPSTTTPTTTPTETPTPPGESYWPCNCTELICNKDNKWEMITTICENPPKPKCTNGLTPVVVWDECCWHWECDCYCTGWGDPHYVTFDGQYYSYQGNCTYVLVEEIHKKIDNFGVYIDNYHCDAREKVSCPRTLIVKYETQEVHVKTLKMFPFIIQVKVNGQEVATPYEKYGMKVFKSGVNYVVEIERIGVNVSYNGLSFSVRLAYHLFGNNTQGQCGTCNNNKTDDCMLPNGKFPGSCETMADHWVVHDPEKPQCTPSVIPTQSPPPVPDTCKPSALCELFKGSVFEKCHRLVNYHNYYSACIYDSCFVPNSQLECASLQIYATICADQGVCVDWRGYTHGTCALKCPSHRVYKACGPVEEVTCKSSQIAVNYTNHMEGCFCPDGTMPYGGGVDVCVKTCGCVGPDNEPREFGERFEFDCKNCICLEGGSGIKCEPLICEEKEDKTSCKNEGFYEVTEVNSDNICCNRTFCRCDVALCTTIPPKCKLGYQLESSIPNGMCCPVYKCAPKKVCVHDNAEYLPGSPVLGDKCEICLCTENVNSTGQNIVTCHHIPCNTRCSQGYELKDIKGECCPKCEQTKCIVKKNDGISLVLSPGQMQTDPTNNCTVYSCVLIKGQFISSTSEITCPAFSEENCKPGTITLLPNGCCKTCIPQDTPLPCSVTRNLEYINHNGCRSVEKVVLTHCEGSCGTLSIYSAEASSMEHKCSCCRETETTKKEALLRCPNGKTKTYKYLHVNNCKCFNTECTVPGSSEEAKSSEHSKENVEQGAIERIKRAIQRIMQ
ncbi:mucin-2-like [Pelodiscus sinensis]|uniref:mucin-2-like n=1 Tax=Pelodiscus sinensis TaxID=13735 RepID=UPI003F6A61A3